MRSGESVRRLIRPACMSECWFPARNDRHTARRPGRMRSCQLLFVSEAWISGYEPLIPRMTNDEKDRHVVAAAVHGGSQIIITLNLRHFRPEHLEPWGIRALHPQSFLIEIFRQERSVVMTKLEQQAADRGRSLRQLLDILSAT